MIPTTDPKRRVGRGGWLVFAIPLVLFSVSLYFLLLYECPGTGVSYGNGSVPGFARACYQQQYALVALAAAGVATALAVWFHFRRRYVPLDAGPATLE